ncbi:MAG: AMP-binding protein [Caldilineaceae bacterium]
MNLSTLFAIALERSPDKVALEFSDAAQPGSVETYSYRELYAAVARWAGAFQQMGVQKGDRIAFFLGNRPEFVIAYLAVIRLGAVMVPVNLRYRKREINHILHDCTAKLLLTETAQQPVLDELEADDLADVERVLLVDSPEEWLGGETVPAPVVVQGEDLALIMYTSGTTGRSKGAMLTHNNVLATVTGLLSAWAWAEEDVILLPLPLFHTHGLMVGLHCALAAGATTRLRPKFDLAETLDVLGSGGATLYFAVPTIYFRLVERIREMTPKPDFSRMRLFCSGSAPLPAETHNEFEQLTGLRILERYGMTETGMNFSNPYAGPRLAGTVGTPLPGVFGRIVDGQSNPVQPGEEGEMLVRGSNVFDGYWRDPEKTAASFSTDAKGIRWFHTGDLARQDPETGYVTLLGRRHELIICGGFNIYPREIEEMLCTFAGVVEAAVVGMAHPEWGEVPAAFLVCDGAVDEEALITYCRGQLASFKLPKRFRYIEALPRNAMGKVQKHLLPRD